MKKLRCPHSTHIAELMDEHEYKLQNDIRVFTHFPSDPNKFPSIIDLCISNGIISQSITKCLYSTDQISDHAAIGFEISSKSSKDTSLSYTIPVCKNTNWPKFMTVVNDLSHTDNPLHRAG
jgi:hypothetical protein